jgi:hypothetical protein
MTTGNGMTLAVYRVDRDGTHIVKPRTQFTGSDWTPWPWGDGRPRAEPPCDCDPNCRYLHGGDSSRNARPTRNER